jgi:hypothetical protein
VCVKSEQDADSDGAGRDDTNARENVMRLEPRLVFCLLELEGGLYTRVPSIVLLSKQRYAVLEHSAGVKEMKEKKVATLSA